MSWKKRTIFKRCVSILLIIALIPIADFSGVVAYAETADNGLLKNITLKAEVNAQGNVELQWNKVTGASKYVINKNGDELTSIDSSDIESNNSKDLLYIDKETEANKEYTYIVVAFNTNDDKLGTCDAVNVKMPEELVISGNYTLDRNMTVYNLKQTWGTLNLNGYTLNICKEYSHNGGILSVGEGIINCYGKYTSASNAEIVMDNANGKITFYEDITWGSSNGSRIENGVIEAKKDVSYTDGGRFV